MSDRKTIQDELRSLQSTLPIMDSPVFTVPEGYFERLATAVLAKIKNVEASFPQAELEEISPLLASIPKALPYSVPSFYFQETLVSASAMEQEADSPVLLAAGRHMPYEVPAGYFASLSKQIISKVTAPKARVVPLFARTWMRVAAAAVIAGAVLFGGLLLFNSNTENNRVAGNNPAANTTLVAQNKPAIDQEIKKVPTQELEQFIENVAVATSESKSKSASAEKDAEALLEDISVKEMEIFLSSLPLSDDDIGGTD